MEAKAKQKNLHGETSLRLRLFNAVCADHHECVCVCVEAVLSACIHVSVCVCEIIEGLSMLQCNGQLEQKSAGLSRLSVCLITAKYTHRHTHTALTDVLFAVVWDENQLIKMCAHTHIHTNCI